MIETLKSWLFSLFALLVVIALGYWAFSSIESGSEHAVNERIEDLEKQNKDLEKEVDKLNRELANYKPVQTDEPKDSEVVPVSTTPVAYKHQTLITELEKLATDNISMKVGSRGTRVGSVQNFLNLYNNTKNKVDNAYGEGTKKSVATFQKNTGLPADGNAGPATYQKMIEWLKTQG